MAAAQLESGKSFDRSPARQRSADKVSSFCQDSIGKPVTTPNRPSKTGTKALEDGELEDWLGGRDSNPDTMVQSHVSYRWTTSHQEGGNHDYTGQS